MRERPLVDRRLTGACKFGLASKDSCVGLPLLKDIDITKSIRGPVYFVCLLCPLEGPIQIAVYLGDDGHVVAGPAGYFTIGAVCRLTPDPGGVVPVTRLRHAFGDAETFVAPHIIIPGHPQGIRDDACCIVLPCPVAGLYHGFFVAEQGRTSGKKTTTLEGQVPANDI